MKARILIPIEPREILADYHQALAEGEMKPGQRVRTALGDKDLRAGGPKVLLDALLLLKKPLIFVESEVGGDGAP